MKPQLFYPCYPFHVNQQFGGNIPCVKNFGEENQIVVNGADNQTCPIGFDKLYSHFGMSGHNGTDLMAFEQDVLAAYPGTVIEKQTVPARGLGLGILSNGPVDLGEYGTHYLKIRYWHLKSFNVEVGEQVKVGQKIGISDNTGYSSGDHLHFEGQPMDKDAGGHPYLVNPEGSIAGAIDIEPYFIGVYAKDFNTWIGLKIKLLELLKSLLTLITQAK